MVIDVGDFILEVSRFNKTEYTIYKIVHKSNDGGLKMEVMAGGFGFKRGAVVTGEHRCLFGHRNTKWLCYYLPIGEILYG